MNRRTLGAWRRPFVFVMSLLYMGMAIPALAQRPLPVYRVNLANGITPPAAAFAQRALQEAVAADASAFVVQVSYSGAVLDAAWSLARALHDAPIPVVVWVGPEPIQGGAAALLLAASDVAAMAPDARIGVALPLSSTPLDFSLQTRQLLLDDVVREVSGWQNEYGRNAGWFGETLRTGAVIGAERARTLDPPLIDLIAATEEELQIALSGRQIVLPDGEQVTLDTVGAPVTTIGPTALETLGQLLAVPTVAFVLFVLGGIALFLEFANPGIAVPGVAGGALVLAALYGFVQADVRPFAVLLLVGALVLVGLEHVVMSHGGLTVAGIILLVGGALWLVDPVATPGFVVAPVAIGGMAVLLGVAVAALVSLALRVRTRAPATGAGSLVGQIAEVRRPIDPEGMVYVEGALWSAWSDDAPIGRGELVEVAGIENLRLYVRRVTGDPEE